MLVRDQETFGVDAGVLQEPTGSSGVLADDDVGLTEHFDRTGRQVTKVADRRCNQCQAPRHRARGYRPRLDRVPIVSRRWGPTIEWWCLQAPVGGASASEPAGSGAAPDEGGRQGAPAPRQGRRWGPRIVDWWCLQAPVGGASASEPAGSGAAPDEGGRQGAPAPRQGRRWGPRIEWWCLQAPVGGASASEPAGSGAASEGRTLPPPHVAWLVTEGRVLATAEIAGTFRTRLRGLLKRNGIDGCLVIERARSVHTIGMRFDIDVAYIGSDGTVLRIDQLRRHRIGRPVPRAVMIVEAEWGAFDRWSLHVGDRVELRP